MTIKFKLLFLLIGTLVIATIAILIAVNMQFVTVIDENQQALYSEKIDTILGILQGYDERLHMTGQVEAYSDAFRGAAIKALRKTCYRQENQRIYPFIINHDDEFVMHPNLPAGDLSGVKSAIVSNIHQSRMQALWSFESEKNWYIFKPFANWNWVVAYTVPLEVKYAEVQKLRQILITIMIGITALYIIVMWVTIVRITKPIGILTQGARAIAIGNYSSVIDETGSGELLQLILDFNHMAEAVNDKVLDLNQEIDERKKVEKALRKSEDRLRKAQKVARIGSWEYDIQTGKVWGSEEAFRIYGIERKTPFFPLEEVENCIIEAKRVNQSLIDLINKNVPYDIEFEINPVNREGVTVIHSIAELVSDASGNPVNVLGVMQDITESKLREKDRVKLRAQLEQAQKMESVGRLAGGVAHDFNNMLGVILGHTEMIMDQTDQSHLFFSNLKEIQKAAMRSADLTRQLLAFARKQTVSPKVLDLNQTVDSMLNMLQRLIGENIDLAWMPGKKLWPVKIDPSQIDQILANLCVNARDAIAGVGKLTIETGNSTFDEFYCAVHPGFIPGQYVFMAVSDNGSGMDAETQAKIFEPFFTTKGMDKGTGLGLSTVYGIVKQNNGFINVYSEPGQGTTFKIYLSRHMGKVDQVREKDLTEPPVHGNETILLVEDEPAILNLTTKMLQHLGYTVLPASTPGEAISIAREHMHKIDLLMTDVVMPEMNGKDLAKNLLALHPKLKRLFMSGYTANVIAHHGVLDKGVYFIQKPFLKKDLADSVKKVLEE